MQPDLPEPVVPAISRCGMRARSVQTAAPEMSLPSQTETGLAVGGQVVVDVAEHDDVRREVRHLDADRLLAGDRREDADLRRRERVREVVLELRDLRHLRAGRELQLVARDARAGDLADDGRLDAEVREALDEHLGDALGLLAVRALAGLRLAGAASGRAGGRRACSAAADVEERLLRVLLVGRRRRRRRRARRAARGCGLADDVGVVLRDVDRRLGAARGAAGGDGAAGAGRGGARRARGGRGVEACRTAWPERRTIAPSEAPVRKSTPAIVSTTPRIVAPAVPSPRSTSDVEAVADDAAVRRAEREQQPDERDDEPEPERPHRDELAARDDQRADRDEHDRRDVRGPADRRRAAQSGDRARR